MGSEEDLRFKHDEGKYKPLDEQNEEEREPTFICWGKIKVPRDPMEVTSLLSLGCLAFGILLIGVGFGVPRAYTYDPDEEAKTMETIEIYYAKLTKRLDICIIVGLGFVGLSALLMSSIVLYLMCYNPKRQRTNSAASIGPEGGSNGSQQETSLLGQHQTSTRQYGTQEGHPLSSTSQTTQQQQQQQQQQTTHKQNSSHVPEAQ